MTLTIDLPPEQAILLRQEAAAYGMDESEYVSHLLKAGLEKEKGSRRSPMPSQKTERQRDEHMVRVKAARGLLADARGSVEEFLREKHKEKEREERTA